MIVIFKKDAPQEAIQALCRQFEAQGLKIHNSMGEHTHLVGLIGDTSAVDADLVRANAAVEEVKRVSEPYKKANRKFHPEDTVVIRRAAQPSAAGTFPSLRGRAA